MSVLCRETIRNAICCRALGISSTVFAARCHNKQRTTDQPKVASTPGDQVRKSTVELSTPSARTKPFFKEECPNANQIYLSSPSLISLQVGDESTLFFFRNFLLPIDYWLLRSLVCCIAYYLVTGEWSQAVWHSSQYWAFRTEWKNSKWVCGRVFVVDKGGTWRESALT
jgi:hypothetical protein